LEYDREIERYKERERKKREIEEIEKLEDSYQILRRLYRDTEEYSKMKHLKEYDRNVTSLSNVSHLISKSNYKKKLQLPKISDQSTLKGILKSPKTDLRISLPFVALKNLVTISPKNQSYIFLTENSPTFRKNTDTSKEFNISM
jgi:hypothetical protein